MPWCAESLVKSQRTKNCGYMYLSGAARRCETSQRTKKMYSNTCTNLFLFTWTADNSVWTVWFLNLRVKESLDWLPSSNLTMHTQKYFFHCFLNPMMAEFDVWLKEKTTLMVKQCLDYFSWSEHPIKSMNIRQRASLKRVDRNLLVVKLFSKQYILLD